MTIYDEMRDWLLECSPDEDEEEFIHELTNFQLVRCIEKNFSGGLNEFLACCNYVQSQ